ncbi:O-antigen ligase family protein [Hydrogenophaga luteola]|uniref:O-antigen ligase family protein n=1 Tax=Hydrogenophaga luteola TaxID=1591122 RepID=A0ABV7W5M8_9BURK
MSFRTLARRAAIYSLALLFGAFPMSVALANSLMLIVVVLWALSLDGTDLREFLRSSWANPVVRPALALALLIVLASFWSPATWAEIGGYYKKYVKFLLLPVFIFLLARREDRAHCWTAFGLALLFTLVSTWLNVWFQLPWSRTYNQGFGADHTVFKDHISQGIMMSLFTVLCAHWAIKATSNWSKVLCWLVAGLAAVSILVLTQGRTGYLSLLLATVVFSLSVLWRRPQMLLGVVLVGALALMSAYTLSPQFQHRTNLAWQEAQNHSAGTVTSIGARIEVWRFMVRQTDFDNAKLMGAGTASYPVLARSYFKDPKFCDAICPHPHNQFILFYFEQGLPGFVLILWFMGAIVRQGLRFNSTHRALMLAFVSIMLTSNMTHSSLWLSTESHFFILMTALLMASAGQRRTPVAQASPA